MYNCYSPLVYMTFSWKCFEWVSFLYLKIGTILHLYFCYCFINECTLLSLKILKNRNITKFHTREIWLMIFAKLSENKYQLVNCINFTNLLFKTYTTSVACCKSLQLLGLEQKTWKAWVRLFIKSQCFLFLKK